MRILIGTHEIGRQVYDLADGFRRLGHDVDTVMAFRNPYLPELQYSYVYDQQELAEFVQAMERQPALRQSEPGQLLAQLVTGYDLYLFNFASSLLPWNRDLPTLKQLGKKVVCFYQGSDVRHWSAAEPVAEAYGYQIPSMYREAPYDDLHARLHNLRMGERYADAIFSLPFQSELAIRPYHHIVLPLHVAHYEQHIPGRDVPVLVHAPSRRNFKGTSVFLEVLDRLRAEGVAFELRLLEGVPNREVVRALVDADVVLDELNAPHFAMLALEGMATGCAVVAGCDRGYVPLQGESPVYAVRAETLYDRLKLLLTDKSLRLHHAAQGRPFAKEHHDHVGVAAHILSKLEPGGGTPDYYPTFFATRYQLPEGAAVRPVVAKMTAEVVQRCGLPAGVRPVDLVARGLMAALPADGRPLLAWKPDVAGVKQEAWGWSPAHRDADVPAEQEPAGMIVGLVQEAIQAVLDGDHEASGAYLQACITYAGEHPEALEDVDALVAIGRLAQELGEHELAATLLAQAYDAAPERDDLAAALAALSAPQSIAV